MRLRQFVAFACLIGLAVATGAILMFNVGALSGRQLALIIIGVYLSCATVIFFRAVWMIKRGMLEIKGDDWEV